MRNYPALRIAQAYRLGIRNSVSRDNDWIALNQFVKYKKTGNIVTVVGVTDGGFGFGGNDKYGIVGTLPSEYCPSIDIPFVFHAMGGTSYNKSGFINKTGEIKLYDRNSYISYWGFCVSYPIQYSVSRIIKTKQIDTTTDLNGYFETGLNARQIPIGIGGMYDARYAFHTGSDAQQGRTIRLMAWDGSAGKYSNRKINVIVYYIEV